MCSFNARSLQCFARSSGAHVFFSQIYGILAIQEVQSDFESLRKAPEIWPHLSRYKYGFWNLCTLPDKKGYAGTVIFTLSRPHTVSFGFPGYTDSAGRVITLRFNDVTIINVYHHSIGPNSDHAPRLELDKLLYSHVKNEQAIETVICICDFNVPHSDKDISEKRPWGIIDFQQI